MYVLIMDSLGEPLLTDFPGTRQSMPTVLIVDGDDAFRRQLRTLFERGGGFNPCVEATNGAEALDMAKRLLPDWPSWTSHCQTPADLNWLRSLEASGLNCRSLY